MVNQVLGSLAALSDTLGPLLQVVAVLLVTAHAMLRLASSQPSAASRAVSVLAAVSTAAALAVVALRFAVIA